MHSKNQINQENKCRVLLFESQILIGECLRKFLENDAEISVLGLTESFSELQKQTEALQPDLILLSISSTETNDAEIIAQLTRLMTACKVLLLVSRQESAVQELAVRHGAAGVVYKEQSCGTLLKAIRHIYDGEVWLNQKLITQILNKENSTDGKVKDEDARKIDSLTVREREIIVLVAQGLKNKAIAKTLFISEATVRHHLTSIFNKLGVKNRMNLLIFGYKHKLISPEKP